MSPDMIERIESQLSGSAERPSVARVGRVLVLDSGVGGLSILRELRRQLPGVETIYVADSGGFPYGVLGEDALLGRLEGILAGLLPKAEPDAVVIACNTASTLALPRLRERFALPFVGCVPAIKPAAERSRTRTIGLLATPATVGRAYVGDLIARFAADCCVVAVGAERLAALAEAKLRGHVIDPDEVRAEVAPLFAASQPGDLDAVVLGCTHYRFLLEELQAVAPWPVAWLDPAEAVARQTQRVLAGASLRVPALVRGLASDLAVFTDTPVERPLLASALRQFGLNEIRVLPLAA